MIGYGSAAVNDQLIPVPVKAAYHPVTMGPAWTGPGMWARQGVWNLPPVLPSPVLQATMAPQSWGMTPGEGYPAVGEPVSPFHPTQSPFWWGLLALVIGVVALRYIFWRE